MSVQQEVLNSPAKKTSIFTKIKIGLAVIVVFFLVIAATIGILYLTNERAKSLIDTQIKSYNAQKQFEEKAKISGDTRISELAKYYTTMSVEDAGNKMLDIKKSDKNAYESIMSSMMVINPDKTSKIRNYIDIVQSKSDIIKSEYEEMKKQSSSESDELAKYYESLGIKGAIDAIKKELQSGKNYDKVSSALSRMKAGTVAKILNYTNPNYIEGIRNRFTKQFNDSVERERQNYLEFLRKYSSLGALYEKTEEKMAAKELQDSKKFSNDQLSVIFSNMDYLSAARILKNFEDESKVQAILTEIKNFEDYQMNFDGSFSTVVANSLKVLKKYDEDVDILRKAYEKMQSADLAKIIDKLVNTNPIYKNYRIDNMRSFSINERQMAIDVLKKMKPALVGDLLAQLKNDNKADKAAYISREIGIPNSTTKIGGIDIPNSPTKIGEIDIPNGTTKIGGLLNGEDNFK